MKVLIDPDWADLAQDLSVEEKAELLMCMLEYPRRDCALGLWRFIRRQLDKDAKKYHEKCARIAENSNNRWPVKSDTKSETISDMKSDTTSQASLDSDSDSTSNTFIEKEKVKKEKAVAVNSLLQQFNKSHRMDGPVIFEITYDFSFEEIVRRNSIYSQTFSPFLPGVLKKAQDSLIKKRYGQKLTLQQLISWIEQAQKYYDQDNPNKE